jgi:farnesyl diphosphate synthase
MSIADRQRRHAKSEPTDTAAALFTSRLHQTAADTEAVLERLLCAAPLQHERARPARLLAAMRHAALDGGKRFRPFLVVESANLFGVPRAQALMTGAAFECVHCYSLIHDDLPAMDNDTLRRGKPTVHKAFDEATAILAGDALLTLAFDILSRAETHAKAQVRADLVSLLARAAGIGGMVGGQMLDLAAEGRFGDTSKALDAKAVTMLQAMKTGALIRAACVAGAVLGGADPTELAALDRFGAAVGEAFQIADDLLDVTGDAATLGKSTHKDAAAGKATLVAIYGVARARERLASLVGEAAQALSSFGSDASVLTAAARFVAERQV